MPPTPFTGWEPIHVHASPTLSVRVHHLPFVIPMEAVRAGAGLGAGVHSVKALHALLSPGPPELSAEDNDKVEVFGMSFN